MTKKILSKIKHIVNRLKPYKPLQISNEVWDNQFSSGHWNYLSDISQMSRYSIITGFIDFFFDGNASVLDLGCGQGVLFRRLKNQKHNYYLGIDVSNSAIIEAQKIANVNSNFICGDIVTFEPDRKFDVIVFNECLYYLEDPIKIINKYVQHLSSDGKIIISMWNNAERNNKLWQNIENEFKVIDDLYLEKIQASKSWRIKII